MANEFQEKITKVKTAMDNRYENKQSNKKTDISGSFTGDENSYPTAQAVKTYVNGLGYITEHQDISGKEDINNKVNSWSGTTNDTRYPSEKLVKDSLDNKEDTSNKVTSWSVTTTDVNYPSEKLVKTSLDEKISKSNTTGLVKNDGTIDTSTYLTSHQDLSNYVTNDDSRLTDARTPTSHTQATSTITNNVAYNNIKSGESVNLTLTNQALINAAINDKLNSLASIELVEVTNDLGTASSSTMNKLYLIAESSSSTNDNYEIYVTVRTGTSGNYSYAWEKIDSTRIDLSGYVQSNSISTVATTGSYDDLSDKPSFTPTITANTTGAYKIGSIDISGTAVDIYGRDAEVQTDIEDVDARINQALDDLAELIYPTTPQYNGETVTINLGVYEDRGGFTHGMGLFLFDTETTYNDFNDLRANVDYSDFIPLEPNETTVYATNWEFSHQFVFNNVEPGQYYLVLCDYDENNLPLLRQGSSNNLLAYLNEDDENITNSYTNSMPYDIGDKPIIEVVANGTNVWYALTDN